MRQHLSRALVSVGAGFGVATALVLGARPSHRPPARAVRAADGIAHRAVDPDTAALALARRFIVVWWLSDWRDAPGTLARRATPMVVPALAVRLAGGVGGPPPVLAAIVTAERRRTTVTAPVAVVADRLPGALAVDVTATATVGVDGRAPRAAVVAVEVLEVTVGGRWLVEAVDQ